MHETPYEREPGYALRYRDERFHSGTGAATDADEDMYRTKAARRGGRDIRSESA